MGVKQTSRSRLLRSANDPEPTSQPKVYAIFRARPDSGNNWG
jgi:hypothetical protein